MPLRLIDRSQTPNTLFSLTELQFIDNEEGRCFRLFDASGNEVRIEYIPQFVSNWSHDRYDIFLFENPYLTAENDIFQLYESTLGKNRLGWIFPITALDSNDHDYADDKYFKHYRYVAYWKILELDIQTVQQEGKSDFKISELIPNVCVCLLSKEEISKIPDFRIEDYAVSFLKYDYLLYQGKTKGIAVFDKTDFIQALRKGNHKLTIKKAAYNINNDGYTKSLFIDHLYQSENFLVKYVLLYQIIEYFIQEIGDAELDEIIKSYQNKSISKNRLKEKIARFHNDRSLIKKVFEKTEINKETKKIFIEKCEYLFGDIGEEIEGGFENIIYDFRNLVTHRYRVVSTKTIDLKNIILLFESVIIDLILNYNQNNVTNNEEQLPIATSTKKNTEPPSSISESKSLLKIISDSFKRNWMSLKKTINLFQLRTHIALPLIQPTSKARQ